MPNTIEVRKLDDTALEAAMALVWRVFERFEAPDYSEAGVAEFRRFIQPKALRPKVRAGEIFLWGAYWDGALAGVLAARAPFHISLLFVEAACHRRGLARAMLEEMRIFFKMRSGCDTITVNSSPYAVEAYHHLGFEDTGPEQTENGLRFTPMTRLL